MNILDYCINQMKEKGISFGAGLSNTALSSLEQTLGFLFPADYAAFLAKAVPQGDSFFDWNAALVNPNRDFVKKAFGWPLKGIKFDIKHNDFWIWGEKPTNLEDQYKKIEDLVANAPTLIPIYSHRYIPAQPKQAGNPIYSVYQTDIIYYGLDLADYFSNEFSFELPSTYTSREVATLVPFWSDLVS